MNPQVPVPLPAGTTSLPPLGGRLFLAYRWAWWLLLALALAAVALSWIDPAAETEILVLRLVKSVVLIAVCAILFRRRSRDSVAAMLSLAFLLWTASSSIDISSAAVLPAVLDRFRFLLFAMALLLFPDGRWQPRWSRKVAAAIFVTFLLGVAEAAGSLDTSLYLPIAIGCVLAALAALLAKYRALDGGTEKQQLKWVTLGLFTGISLILTARGGAALTANMAMPLVGSVLIEGLFQLGIIILALGFLISLLRYRLYDAEAAISRSAIYAALTLSLVGTFAACEALIELFGQRYFGSSIGSISGAVAAAIAAILLTPLHTKISGWAEAQFQHDLAVLKEELPDLLITLSAGGSVKRFAQAVLPHIEQAVQSTRVALIIDGRLAATQGIGLAAARMMLKDWERPQDADPISRDPSAAFPLQIGLRCPLGRTRGWLLLGPRPDGSFHGRDEIEALADIVAPLQRSLLQVAERQAAEARERRSRQTMNRTIRMIEERVSTIERAIAHLRLQSSPVLVEPDIRA